MSLLNQNNKKGKKDKKNSAGGKQAGTASKFIQKPQSASFVSKQQNTGSQRGS